MNVRPARMLPIAERERHHPADVEPGLALRLDDLVQLQERPDRREEAERDVDEEDVAPAEKLGDDAAQDGARG